MIGSAPSVPAATGRLGLWLRVLLLGSGFAGLLVLPFVVPDGRGRAARDPHGQALQHLLAVEPGMIRSVLERHVRRLFRRSDGVEVFAHPDSDILRLDVRLDGDHPSSQVVAVGDPYLAHFPEPRHLR